MPTILEDWEAANKQLPADVTPAERGYFSRQWLAQRKGALQAMPEQQRRTVTAHVLGIPNVGDVAQPGTAGVGQAIGEQGAAQLAQNPLANVARATDRAMGGDGKAIQTTESIIPGAGELTYAQTDLPEPQSFGEALGQVPTQVADVARNMGNLVTQAPAILSDPATAAGLAARTAATLADPVNLLEIAPGVAPLARGAAAAAPAAKQVLSNLAKTTAASAASEGLGGAIDSAAQQYADTGRVSGPQLLRDTLTEAAVGAPIGAAGSLAGSYKDLTQAPPPPVPLPGVEPTGALDEDLRDFYSTATSQDLAAFLNEANPGLQPAAPAAQTRLTRSAFQALQPKEQIAIASAILLGEHPPMVEDIAEAEAARIQQPGVTPLAVAMPGRTPALPGMAAAAGTVPLAAPPLPPGPEQAAQRANQQRVQQAQADEGLAAQAAALRQQIQAAGEAGDLDALNALSAQVDQLTGKAPAAEVGGKLTAQARGLAVTNQTPGAPATARPRIDVQETQPPAPPPPRAPREADEDVLATGYQDPTALLPVAQQQAAKMAAAFDRQGPDAPPTGPAPAAAPAPRFTARQDGKKWVVDDAETGAPIPRKTYASQQQAEAVALKGNKGAAAKAVRAPQEATPTATVPDPSAPPLPAIPASRPARPAPTNPPAAAVEGETLGARMPTAVPNPAPTPQPAAAWPPVRDLDDDALEAERESMWRRQGDLDRTIREMEATARAGKLPAQRQAVLAEMKKAQREVGRRLRSAEDEQDRRDGESARPPTEPVDDAPQREEEASPPTPRPTKKKPPTKTPEPTVAGGSSLEGQPKADAPTRREARHMPLAEFLGNSKITSAANGADLRPQLGLSTKGGKREPFLDGRYEMIRGVSERWPSGDYAVLDGDKVIATYDGRNLVVDKKYRRQGIATELVALYRSENPERPPAEARTKAAQAVQKAAHRRIVERALESGRDVPAEVLAVYPDLRRGARPMTGFGPLFDVAEQARAMADALEDSGRRQLKDELRDITLGSTPLKAGAVHALGKLLAARILRAGANLSEATAREIRAGFVKEMLAEHGDAFRAVARQVAERAESYVSAARQIFDGAAARGDKPGNSDAARYFGVEDTFRKQEGETAIEEMTRIIAQAEARPEAARRYQATGAGLARVRGGALQGIDVPVAVDTFINRDVERFRSAISAGDMAEANRIADHYEHRAGSAYLFDRPKETREGIEAAYDYMSEVLNAPPRVTRQAPGKQPPRQPLSAVDRDLSEMFSEDEAGEAEPAATSTRTDRDDALDAMFADERQGPATLPPADPPAAPLNPAERRLLLDREVPIPQGTFGRQVLDRVLRFRLAASRLNWAEMERHYDELDRIALDPDPQNAGDARDALRLFPYLQEVTAFLLDHPNGREARQEAPPEPAPEIPPFDLPAIADATWGAVQRLAGEEDGFFKPVALFEALFGSKAPAAPKAPPRVAPPASSLTLRGEAAVKPDVEKLLRQAEKLQAALVESDQRGVPLAKRVALAVKLSEVRAQLEAIHTDVSATRAKAKEAAAAITNPVTPPRYDGAKEVLPKGINFWRLDLDQEAKDVFAGVLAAVEPQFHFVAGSKRQGFGEVHAEAMAMLAEGRWDVQRLLRRDAGKALNAVEITASRVLMATVAGQVRELAKAKQSDTDAVTGAQRDARDAALHRGVELLAAMSAQVEGASKTAARALAAHRIMASAQAPAERQIKAILENGVDGINDLAERIADIDDVEALTIAARTEVLRDTWAHKAMEWWVMALLSAPITHARNVFGNALNVVGTLGEEAVAAGISTARAAARGEAAPDVAFDEVTAQWAALWASLPDAINIARLSWRENAPMSGVSQVDAHEGAIKGRLGEIVRTPGRALMAEDEFFKVLAYRMSLAQQAAAEARQQAVKKALPKEVERALATKLTFDPTETMIDRAIKEAHYRTFQQKMGDIGGMLLKAKQQHPLATFVVPFVKTPVNLVKYAGERSALAPFAKPVRDELQAGGARRDRAMAKMALGSTFMALAGFAAMAGMITGTGPEDPDDKATLMATGWRPYAFKVGGYYLPFNQVLGPYGMLMGAMGDIAERVRLNGSDVDKRESGLPAQILDVVALGGLTALRGNVLEQTFLRGLHDFSNMVYAPGQFAQRWVGNIAAGFVPNVVGKVADAADPFQRDQRGNNLADEVRRRMQAKLPGASRLLPESADLLGQPLERSTWNRQVGLTGLPFPAYPGSASSDKLLAEMVRLGENVSKAPRKLEIKGQDIPLNADQRRELGRLKGQAFSAIARPYVEAAAWDAATEDEQRAVLEKLRSKASEVARAQYVEAHYDEVLAAFQAGRGGAR